jgi:hypothetical protein
VLDWNGSKVVETCCLVNTYANASLSFKNGRSTSKAKIGRRADARNLLVRLRRTKARLAIIQVTARFALRTVRTSFASIWHGPDTALIPGQAHNGHAPFVGKASSRLFWAKLSGWVRPDASS